MIIKNLLLSQQFPDTGEFDSWPRTHGAKKISSGRCGTGKRNLQGDARLAPLDAWGYSAGRPEVPDMPAM